MKHSPTHIGLALTLGIALTLALLWLLGGGLPAARAATITVINTNDSGPGSLRQAIADANPNDTIEFSLTYPANIMLTSGPLVIFKNLTIAGPGAISLIIDGNHASRVFNIYSNVTIIDLTVQNGSDSYGAGIYTTGALTLTNVNVLSNTARSGGCGVYVFGPAMLSGGLFQNNLCLPDIDSIGGGLAVGGTLALSGTQFISNTAGVAGGGVYANGAATFSGGLFLNNHASVGGGLFANSTLALSSTQFVDNTAFDSGGGVYVRPSTGGTSHMINALFARNAAAANGAALYFSISGGSAVVLHTTIASPTVGVGPAIYVYQGTVGITDTIVASYTTSIEAATGATVASDYNLFFNAPTSVITGIHSITDANPLFRNPPGNDYHLTIGSPAIDRGASAGVTTDLDGNPRPQGGAPDIGAYEFPWYTLTVNTTGYGSGVVTPTVGTYGYASGTTVWLTATANAGSTFAGWSGAVTSTTNPISLVMDANKTVTATFNSTGITTNTLTVNNTGNGRGSVTTNPIGSTFAPGTVVTLTAVPSPTSSFAGWSGAVTGTTNPVTLTMNSNKVVTVTFHTCMIYLSLVMKNSVALANSADSTVSPLVSIQQQDAVKPMP